MRKQTRCSKSLIGGETGVSPFWTGTTMLRIHRVGTTHRQDEVEEIEQGALPPSQRDLEHGGVRHFVKTHCRIHANPQSGPQLTKSDPSRVPGNRAPREGPDGPAKCVELSTRQPVDCELKKRRHDLAGEILLVAWTRWNCCCVGFHTTNRAHLRVPALQKHNQISTKRVMKER